MGNNTPLFDTLKRILDPEVVATAALADFTNGKLKPLNDFGWELTAGMLSMTATLLHNEEDVTDEVIAKTLSDAVGDEVGTDELKATFGTAVEMILGEFVVSKAIERHNGEKLSFESMCDNCAKIATELISRNALTMTEAASFVCDECGRLTLCRMICDAC